MPRLTPGFSLCAMGLLVLAAAACGGRSAPRRAALIVAYPQGLVEMAPDGTSPRTIVATADGRIPANPAASPDGAHIAYTEPAESGTGDTGADLWLSDRDGGHRHLLVPHRGGNLSLRWPRWLDDRHILVVMDVPASCDGCNPQTTTAQDLEQVDVTNGDLTLLRHDVLDFDVAPGGVLLVFPDARHDTAEGLQTASTSEAATPARQIVPLDQRFAHVASPRFSPAGDRIAFAAAESGAVEADQEFVTRASFAPPGAPSADGLPANVWLVGADGSGLRLLAALHENTPSLAWSADGSTLYAVGAAALYRIDARTGAVTRIGRGAPGASLAYAPAERAGSH